MTTAELVNQLRRHLRFIETSSEAFDSGLKDEALRIAVSLRVIFHDTNHSTSLLTHMGKKDSINLLSTIGNGQTKEDLKDQFVLIIPVMLTLDGVQPPLGLAKKNARVVPCMKWWEEVVMAQQNKFSRKDIVLSAANQDGGAHVDLAPNSKTSELRNGIGTFTRRIGGVEISTETLQDHHLPLLRQFAYEVLNSPELTALAR